eukprot:TRINITY_DN15465_c0_g1_i1.p2 TRINITY_DN15465_c0_g1~~TRINITY_DN15465_c0_g1_i1.p2  ORF type:complete len:57 (+),score=12.78 TRINITY_DN15465_c0_g1_i1:153-323(+)
MPQLEVYHAENGTDEATLLRTDGFGGNVHLLQRYSPPPSQRMHLAAYGYPQQGAAA